MGLLVPLLENTRPGKIKKIKLENFGIRLEKNQNRGFLLLTYFFLMATYDMFFAVSRGLKSRGTKTYVKESSF